MWFNRIVLVGATIILISVTFMLTGSLQNRDPFAPYRQFTPGPLAIKPALLKHFAEPEKLAREKLNLDLSPRERSIIAGLHWLTVYADEDKYFNDMFADFMLLLNVLAHSEDRHHQREVVTSLARASLTRASRNLSAVFGKEEGDRFRFFEMAQAFRLYPEFKSVFLDFYRSHFPRVDVAKYQNEAKDFQKALKAREYGAIFDFLVQTSFLHHNIAREPTVDIDVPPNDFEKFLKLYEAFDYVKNQNVYSPLLRDQGYLATHIPLVLTNYGELPLGDGINRRKAEKYIEETLEPIQNEMGDFDLFAEYVQCIKMQGQGKPSRIAELEAIIYSLQRPNGSWGSERDFTTSPYTAIHPTGAALMALNESNSAAP